MFKEISLCFRIALKFGIITCVAGFLGVGLGSESARRLRKTNSRADPLVCAFGLIMCAPFLFFALVLSKYNTTVTWVSTSKKVSQINLTVQKRSVLA